MREHRTDLAIDRQFGLAARAIDLKNIHGFVHHIA
jgi:hypothetical protein